MSIEAEALEIKATEIKAAEIKAPDIKTEDIKAADNSEIFTKYIPEASSDTSKSDTLNVNLDKS